MVGIVTPELFQANESRRSSPRDVNFLLIILLLFRRSLEETGSGASVSGSGLLLCCILVVESGHNIDMANRLKAQGPSCSCADDHTCEMQETARTLHGLLKHTSAGGLISMDRSLSGPSLQRQKPCFVLSSWSDEHMAGLEKTQTLAMGIVTSSL